MLGKKFNKLLVLEKTTIRKNGYVIYDCQCDCGNIVQKTSYEIKRLKSCGKCYRQSVIGTKYNYLTIVEPTNKRNSNGKIFYKCQCDCGNIVHTTISSLKKGDRKSCGCKRKKDKETKIKKPRYKDLTGKIFGKLKVLYLSGYNIKNKLLWCCQCECGNIKLVKSSLLLSGDTKSCGCLSSKAKDINDKYFVSLFTRYKTNAIKRNYKFELDLNQFKQLISKECYYCGEKESNTFKLKNGYFLRYNGIDRKNNNEGYTESNSVSCCSVCNKAKMTLSCEEFIILARKISEKYPYNKV